MSKLTGKVAVVTGASSGIGEATARQFVRAGGSAVLIGRDEARLKLVAESTGRPEATVALSVDLLDDEALARTATRSGEAFGAIDAVIHSAAILEMSPLATVEAASIDRMWNTNARAPMLFTSLVLPHLSDRSSIVYVSSTVAHAGFASYAPYSATKGAIEAFARALSVELAPRTRVNVIAPGFVATPMLTDQYPGAPGLEDWVLGATPLGFICSGDDIASSILVLSSDELSRYITGTTVISDGGWTAKG